MNNQRPYGQPMARPANPAGPTIRAGLSVQELKAMTAMRVAHDDPSKGPSGPSESAANFRNPASSYQTATPQQLRAAGIQPVVMNDRNLPRQKSSTFNSFPIYNSNTSYQEPVQAGQPRPFGYDDTSLGGHSAPPMVSRATSDQVSMSTTSYAKASSTAGHGFSSFHPQTMTHRNGMPQINSVEDVKELTRLRMLMSERDALFDGPASRNNEANGYATASAEPILSMASTDSYDSFEFSKTPLDLHGSPAFGAATAPSATTVQKSLFAPPSQQAFSIGGPVAHGAPGAKVLQQSSSVGGLGVRGTHFSGMGPPSQAAPLNQSYAPGSTSYLPPQGLTGSTVRPGPQHMHPAGASSGMLLTGPPQSSAGLALTGSSVLGGRRPGQGPDRALAPLTQHPGNLYGSPYQQNLVDRGDLDASLAREPPRVVGRGIERDLMLSTQMPHGQSLMGGIDHFERSLNGHTSVIAPRNAQQHTLHAHGIFDDVLNHGHGNHANGHGSAQHDPFARGPHHQQHQHQQQDLLLGGGGLAQRGGYQHNEASLHSLLGEPHDVYRGLGSAQLPGQERQDTFFDVLVRDNHHSARLPPTHPQKIVLDPLMASPSSPSPSAAPLAVPRRDATSPIQLAPLTPSPEKEKASPTAAATGSVRKLSMVPKAATFNTVETAKKATTPPLRDLSDVAPLPNLSSRNAGPATSPPHRVHAFGDTKLEGIASPSADEEDALSNLSPSPESRKYPMQKAHTTSRIPIDTSNGALSPKMLIIRQKMSNSNSSEHTPPHTSNIDRTGTSDSTSGMNFLASEMAEMVLDTPSQGNKAAAQNPAQHFYPWDDRDYQGHLEDLLSRDNSNDLNRLMGAMSGSNDVSEHSGTSSVGVSVGLYKRNNSISFNE